MNTSKGALISFEGIDGCGKSTQMDIAAEYLREKGHDVLKTREPGGTKLAEKIREILLDNSHKGQISPMAELMLYLAAREQLSAEIILPHIEKNGTVLTDRYADSSTAYQGGGRELGIELVEQLNELVIPRWPDLTILFDIPVEVGLTRIGDRRPDRLEEEGIAFLNKVRDAFTKIVERHPDRITVVDSSGSVENTAKAVKEAIDKYLQAR